MEYKYSPIYKYIILLICIFMFIKHLKIMINQQNLMITITIIIMVMIFDYVLIEKHPNLFSLSKKEENFLSSENIGDTISKDEIDEILENYDPEDMQKELDDDEQLEYPHYTEKAFYQLPTDYRQPSYDLDIDCYRRGDGRGNSMSIDRYYHKDILDK